MPPHKLIVPGSELDAEVAALNKAEASVGGSRLWIAVDGEAVVAGGAEHRALDEAGWTEFHRLKAEALKAARERLGQRAEASGGVFRPNENGTITVRFAPAPVVRRLAGVAPVCRPRTSSRAPRSRRSRSTRRARSPGRRKPADPDDLNAHAESSA